MCSMGCYVYIYVFVYMRICMGGVTCNLHIYEVCIGDKVCTFVCMYVHLCVVSMYLCVFVCMFISVFTGLFMVWCEGVCMCVWQREIGRKRDDKYGMSLCSCTYAYLWVIECIYVCAYLYMSVCFASVWRWCCISGRCGAHLICAKAGFQLVQYILLQTIIQNSATSIQQFRFIARIV